MIIRKQRKLNRLKQYNYSSIGWYFLTLCTHNQKKLFGDIIAGCLVLSQLGKVVEKCVVNIPKFYPHIQVDSYVIMPNHVHLILDVSNFSIRTDQWSVHTNTIQRTYGEVSKCIQSLKGVVTKQAQKIGFEEKIWQRSFNDHIIEDEKELEKIQDYIEENQFIWKADPEWVG